MIRIETAAFAIAEAPEVLSTMGIGSCLAICLYARSKKIGALGHIMLPKHHEGDSNPLLALDTGIPIMIDALEKKDIKRAEIEAKLFGGANMFPNLWPADNSIGMRNINTAKTILRDLFIPITEESLGGNASRSLEFDLNYGKVSLGL